MHKKYQKRLLSLLLVLTLTTGVMYTEYHTAQEVQAIAVVDDIAVILAILAACGVGYVGYEWFNQSDIAGYADEVAKAEESLSRLWDNAVTQFGGDQNPDDFDPDNDDPNEKPPKWEKLKAWAKAHPGATLALGAGGALGAVVTAVTPEILKYRENGLMSDAMQKSDITLPQSFKDNLEKYPYYIINTHHSYNQTEPYLSSIQMFKNAPAMYKNGTVKGVDLDYKTPIDSQRVCTSPSVSFVEISAGSNLQFSPENTSNYVRDFYLPFWIYPVQTGFNFNAYSTNIPVYEDEASAISNCVNAEPKYPGTINPASLPLSTDIMDWLDKNPGKDAPDQPLYDSVKIPTQEEVDTFIQDLEKSRDDEDTEDEQQRQTITNNFIQNITNVNPDPAPDPDPTPDPDPMPDPEPTPDPNPDPTPNPPTDLTDEEKGGFLLPESIKKKFPFCIPFDLIDAFTVLKSDTRQAPRIKWRLQSEKYNIDYTFDIDLSVYDEQSELLRTLELLLFIVGLILATRSLIRG